MTKYDEAIALFDRILAIDPDNLDALVAKGNALYALGKNEQAVSYYDKALEIDPNNSDAMSRRETALNDQ